MALKQEKAFRQLYFELFKKITKSQKLDCMPHCLIASLTTVVILETEQCLIWLQFYITTSNSPWDVPFGYSNKFYLSILLSSVMLFFFFCTMNPYQGVKFPNQKNSLKMPQHHLKNLHCCRGTGQDTRCPKILYL